MDSIQWLHALKHNVYTGTDGLNKHGHSLTNPAGIVPKLGTWLQVHRLCRKHQSGACLTVDGGNGQQTLMPKVSTWTTSS